MPGALPMFVKPKMIMTRRGPTKLIWYSVMRTMECGVMVPSAMSWEGGRRWKVMDKQGGE